MSKKYLLPITLSISILLLVFSSLVTVSVAYSPAGFSLTGQFSYSSGKLHCDNHWRFSLLGEDSYSESVKRNRIKYTFEDFGMDAQDEPSRYGSVAISCFYSLQQKNSIAFNYFPLFPNPPPFSI